MLSVDHINNHTYQQEGQRENQAFPFFFQLTVFAFGYGNRISIVQYAHGLPLLSSEAKFLNFISLPEVCEGLTFFTKFSTLKSVSLFTQIKPSFETQHHSTEKCHQRNIQMVPDFTMVSNF